MVGKRRRRPDSTTASGIEAQRRRGRGLKRVMGFAGSDARLTERNHELPGIESMRHPGLPTPFAASNLHGPQVLPADIERKRCPLSIKDR